MTIPLSTANIGAILVTRHAQNRLDEFGTKSHRNRWFEEWWNQRSETVIEELTKPDCKAGVEGLDEFLNRDGLKEHRKAWLSAVPDIHLEVVMAVTEAPNAVVYWRLTGTHLGPGPGFPPSGAAISINGFTSLEFRGDRIARGIDHWNRGEFIASMMRVRMDELCKHARLTERQAQVALLMADRLTHPEIATELKIKPNTARRHCEKVLQKLGIQKRQDVSQALGKIPASVLNRHASDLARK